MVLPALSGRSATWMGRPRRHRTRCLRAAPLGGETLLRRDGILRGYGHDLVDDGPFEGVGPKPAPMPWILWLPEAFPQAPVTPRAPRRCRGLSASAPSGISPSRKMVPPVPHACHHTSTVAVGVAPDLGSGCLVVGARVGGVHELACHDGARDVASPELVRLGHGAFHPFRAGGEHDSRHHRPRRAAALDRHGLSMTRTIL